MKARPAPFHWRLVVLLLALAAAAFSAGGTAYTKRYETSLLAEPSPLAAVNGKVRFASKLKVKEARGAWLRVSDGSTTGWVFSGNLAAAKPEENAGTDQLGLSASATTATAAARPLTPAASEYADRRNLGDARGDLNWLNTECHSITNAEVDKFLQEKKKGEFQ
jgi:SH3-like domain-containing protein